MYQQDKLSILTPCGNLSDNTVDEFEESSESTSCFSPRNVESYISEITQRFCKLLCGEDVDSDNGVDQNTAKLTNGKVNKESTEDACTTNSSLISDDPQDIEIKRVLQQKEHIVNIMNSIVAEDLFNENDWINLKEILDEKFSSWKCVSAKEYTEDLEKGLELGYVIRDKFATDLMLQVNDVSNGQRKRRSEVTTFSKRDTGEDASKASVSEASQEIEMKDEVSGVGKFLKQYQDQEVLQKRHQEKSDDLTKAVKEPLKFRKKQSFKDLFESKLSELSEEFHDPETKISSQDKDRTINDSTAVTTLFGNAHMKSHPSTSTMSLSSEDSEINSQVTVVSASSEPGVKTSELCSVESSNEPQSHAQVNAVKSTTSLSVHSLRRSASSSLENLNVRDFVEKPRDFDGSGSRQSFYECEMEIAYYQEKLAQIKKEKLEKERQQVVINIYKQQLLDVEQECFKELDNIQQSKQDLIPLEKIVQQWKVSEEDNLDFLSMPPPANSKNSDILQLSDGIKSTSAVKLVREVTATVTQPVEVTIEQDESSSVISNVGNTPTDTLN